jgi:CHAT domain-containing protein
MLSLGLSPAGRDELLGAAEIGGWNVPGSLITLSGCQSAAGAALPGAGLMGMTRAWLMAGTRAVVATQWPIPDDPDGLIRNFYRRLQEHAFADPAGALRAAQLEALRSSGWRSQPDYWAAYFTLGNY